jgi:hypothetical protein
MVLCDVIVSGCLMAELVVVGIVRLTALRRRREGMARYL